MRSPSSGFPCIARFEDTQAAEQSPGGQARRLAFEGRAPMDYDDYDRPPRGSGGYDEMQDASAPNVSFLLTLLTMLDFTTPGQVGKEDWERGIAALHAPGLSWEVSWQMLLRRFDLDNNGSIDFGEMHGLAPLDPRLGRCCG